jgi:O-antigen ligase
MSRFRPALHAKPASVMAPPVPPPTPIVKSSAVPAVPGGFSGLLSQTRFGLLGALLGLYLFMHTAPVAELLDVYFHAKFFEIVITGVLVTIGALLSGRFDRFLNVPMAKWWLAMGLLFFLAAVFGIYRRQSVPFMLAYLVRFHVMPFLICAIALNLSQVRKLMYWPAVGWLIIAATCALAGSYQEDRFHVRDIPALANPNDLSLLLLLTAAYGLMLLFSRSIAPRIVWSVGLVLTLYFVMRTGSRANFLTFLVALGVSVFILPGRAKFAVAIVALSGALSLAFFIPSSTWERLTAISSDPEEELMAHPELAHELGSQLARVELQRRAYQLTIRHPLLGVGPLMFAGAADEMVREETGRKTGWQNAHNVYLQIGAENGIPALVLYIVCFWMCAQMNYRSFMMSLTSQKLSGARAQSYCLFLVTVVLAFGILFCNYVYDALWPVLIGLSAANYLAMIDESKRQSPAVQGVQSVLSR